MHECTRINIEVLPPDINESFRNFAMVSKPGEPGRIRFGLSTIKNVGEHICEVIYQERKKNGQYKNFEDLLKRITDKDLNKKSLESLAKCGALDCFGYDRKLLLDNIENILEFVRQHRENNVSNQNSLFAGTDIALDSKVMLRGNSEAIMDEKLKWEKELLGLYVSSHPFAYYQKVGEDKLLKISDLEDYERDKWVVIGGVIEKATKKITKKGSMMMFATLQDMTGSMELMVFPKTYEQTQNIWQEGNIVCVQGKTPREQGDNKVFVEKVEILTKQNALNVIQMMTGGNNFSSLENEEQKNKTQSVVIYITKQELQDKTEKLKQIFIEAPGDYQVFLKVGVNTIKTNTSIDGNASVVSVLEEVVGKGNVEVFE